MASKGAKKVDDKGLVAVAIDKDKNSPYAIRWAIDNLLGRGRAVLLLHVIKGPSDVSVESSAIISTSTPGTAPSYQNIDKHTRDLFITFRCFCTRKDIRCLDITLKHADVAKALTEYVQYAAIENLVLGASRGGFIRKLKQTDKPTIVSKDAPEFCSVYVISKTKISSVRNATLPVSHMSPLQSQIEGLTSKPTVISVPDTPSRSSVSSIRGENPLSRQENQSFKLQREDRDVGRSDTPNNKLLEEKLLNDKLSLGNLPDIDTDISFVGSDRTSIDQHSPLQYDYIDLLRTPRFSTSSDRSLGSFRSGQRTSDASSMQDLSFVSHDSSRMSGASQPNEEVESEMKRLQLELKQTIVMYNEACKEAVFARDRERKQAEELQRWKLDEETRLEQTGTPEEAAMVQAERRRAEMIAHLGNQRRLSAPTTEDVSNPNFVRYRKYTIKEIERATNSFSESCKIGRGGFGPVFKGYLDHTRVAIKVLSPDAAQGKAQFQREVEILSSIRHPNLVLLLGACPEYGCLVYEYMANGSLDTHLYRQGNNPPLSWQIRFQIVAEITTGLHFLHQTKPEPIVHRDIKPGNILLDRYFVSKIGDVGLARLVPSVVADRITQHCMTSAAGTFCYIDPEYQQTGMLGVKSDVYSLGVVLLQLLTAKRPMGLARQVEISIERGTFADILDPSVPDWPMEEALCMAKIAIQCTELRQKDRPDLTQVLPELERLRNFADDTVQPSMFYASGSNPSLQSQASISPEAMCESTFGLSAASSSQLNFHFTPSSPKASDGKE